MVPNPLVPPEDPTINRCAEAISYREYPAIRSNTAQTAAVSSPP